MTFVTLVPHAHAREDVERIVELQVSDQVADASPTHGIANQELEGLTAFLRRRQFENRVAGCFCSQLILLVLIRLPQSAEQSPAGVSEAQDRRNCMPLHDG